jgi:hypothetical protein
VNLASTSNIDDVAHWLENWVDGIDFTQPEKDQFLGHDIANVMMICGAGSWAHGGHPGALCRPQGARGVVLPRRGGYHQTAQAEEVRQVGAQLSHEQYHNL